MHGSQTFTVGEWSWNHASAAGRLPARRGDVDERKEERLNAQHSPFFEPHHQHSLELTLRLSRQEVSHRVAMGPSAFHIAPAELQHWTARLSEWTDVTASFTVSLHRKRRV